MVGTMRLAFGGVIVLLILWLYTRSNDAGLRNAAASARAPASMSPEFKTLTQDMEAQRAKVMQLTQLVAKLQGSARVSPVLPHLRGSMSPEFKMFPCISDAEAARLAKTHLVEPENGAPRPECDEVGLCACPGDTWIFDGRRCLPKKGSQWESAFKTLANKWKEACRACICISLCVRVVACSAASTHWPRFTGR